MTVQPDGILGCEDVPRVPPVPPVSASAWVTRAWCACKKHHPCYRSDIRECYEFADGPDGLCGGCRPAGERSRAA